MAYVDQAEAAASRGSRRRKKAAVVPSEGERYSPLMSREGHTFALMRDDRSGPRMYSAICLPGWKKA
jgi:hypothetical protein